MAIAQNSEIYFTTQVNDQVEHGPLTDALRYVMTRELVSCHPKRWMRAYYLSGILLFSAERKRLLECRAAHDFFYLAPEGLVYPCLTIPSSMGDLKNHTFEEIWESEQADEVRRKVYGCKQCWMICTARTVLRKKLHNALTWIAKEKIKRHIAG